MTTIRAIAFITVPFQKLFCAFLPLFFSEPAVVIIFNKWQLANRLGVLANFIAFSEEYSIKVFYPFLGAGGHWNQYWRLFEKTSKDYLCSYKKGINKITIKRSKKAEILILKLYGLFVFTLLRFPGWFKDKLIIDGYEKEFTLDDPFFLRKIKKEKIIFIDGHHFYCKKTSKHREKIKKYLIPRRGFVEDLRISFDSIRRSFSLVVGIHIRRGDFKYAFSGKYLHDIQSYIILIRRIQDIFKREKVFFIIFSDKYPLDYQMFSGFDFAFGYKSAIKDLFSMINCDYLTSPFPSTFARFASFLGKVPLYWHKNPEENFRRDDFQVYSLSQWEQ